MKYRTTLIFFLINVIIHIIVNSLTNNDGKIFLDYVGFDSDNPIYTTVTYSFVHLSNEHLLSNMMVFVLYSSLLEDVLNGRQLIFLYIGGAIGGALLYATFCGQYVGLVGASAACFSFVAASMILKFKPILFVITLFFLYKEVFALIVYPLEIIPTQVSHLGGFIFGIFFATVIKIEKHD